MPTLNKVMLMGNLTRDPELRFTKAGTPVANFGFAINESYRDQNNQLVESPVFVEVEVWKREAELVNQYVKKGDPIHIEGGLKFEKWVSKGETRSRLKVRAHRIQFLKPNGEAGNNTDPYEKVVNHINGQQKPQQRPKPPQSPPAPTTSDRPPITSDDDIPF